jgi:hypothetical protein
LDPAHGPAQAGACNDARVRAPHAPITAAVVGCALAAVAGCGGGSTSSTAAAEARFVSSARAICKDFGGTTSHGPTPAQFAALTRLGTLIRAHAQLPRVAALERDFGRRAKLLANPPRQGESSVAPGGRDIVEAAYRLDVKIYNEEVALGFGRCRGRAPRPPIGG